VEDALRSGARIGSCEVIDRLGAGGMGEVYRARDTHIYDVGEAASRAGAHYVVMELVEGETLRVRLRSAKEEVAEIGAERA
jgi:serine/threonine protein kinase